MIMFRVLNYIVIYNVFMGIYPFKSIVSPDSLVVIYMCKTWVLPTS